MTFVVETCCRNKYYKKYSCVDSSKNQEVFATAQRLFQCCKLLDKFPAIFRGISGNFCGISKLYFIYFGISRGSLRMFCGPLFGKCCPTVSLIPKCWFFCYMFRNWISSEDTTVIKIGLSITGWLTLKLRTEETACTCRAHMKIY
jgi:hypothetical protein